MMNRVNVADKKFKLFFFFACLFFTLRSYYFYSISLAPGPVIASAILLFLFLICNPVLTKAEFRFVSILVLIFALSSLGALVSDKPYINSIIGLVINVIIFLSIISLKDKIKSSLNVLNYLFLIHALFFLIQLLAYYLFNEKIDFLQPITGEVQRVSGFERIEDHGGVAVFRPSGLFSEPSSYCAFMITLLWISKKSSFLNSKIEALVLFTIFISFSISGIVFSICYIFLTNINNLTFKKVLSIIIMSSIFLFMMQDQIISYYNYRILNLDSDNSTGERMLMFTIFYDLDLIYQLFGSGVGNDIIDIPLTTIPSLLVYLGIIGTLIFIIYISILFIHYKVSIDSTIFLIVISFNFYKISNPYVWFILAMLLIVSNKDDYLGSDEKKYNT